MPVWFSVSPINPDDGTRTDLRFCNKDSKDVTGVGGETWWPGVGRAPTLNRETFNGSFSSSVALAQATMLLNVLALGKANASAPYYRYAAAPVSVWYFADPADFDIDDPLFEGLVSDFSVDDGVMQLSCTVDTDPFEDNVIDDKYGGTGGADGIEDLKDKFKPATFGAAQNVEPVMIDTVNNVYQVHAYGSIEGIDAVYERALQFDPSLGDYPSYTDLVAADIPEGYWATCLAQGMFRMGAPPFGLITCDVRGDNVGGFHQSTAAIIQRLCDIKGVDPARIDAGSLAAFEAACPESIDLYVTVPVALMDLVQELALPCNAQASLSWTGVLQFTRFGVMPTEATLTLDAQGRQLPPVTKNSELGVSTPFWRMEMEAARCWRVQSKDEIAFLDDDAPVTVYRRYPTKPETPTGNDVPEGWSSTQPGYSAPVNVNDFDQFGPVWESTAMQHAGLTSDDGWSEPVVSDVFYAGWSLISQNVGAKVLGTANGLKAADDFDPDVDIWPYCFINRPVSGAWHLRCRVKGALDRVAIGVVPYDPATLNGGFDASDIKDGFWIAQNDTYVVADNGEDGFSHDPVTGVFIFQEYDATAGYIRTTHGRMLETPVADCEMEMIFNGETVEHYINGEHVRTHFLNNSWEDLLTYWAVFMPLGPGAEITDIQWVRATQARELDYRLEESHGALRRMKDQNGWEVYAPELTEGFGAGWLYSRDFTGGAYCTTKIGGLSGALAASTFEIAGVGGFQFDEDGTMSMYKGLFSVIDTGAWTPGDEFGVKWDRKKITWYKNGAFVHDRKVDSPPDAASLYVEFGAHGSFYDIELTPKEEGELTLKGSGANSSLLTPLSDTSPVATGSYVDLGQTGDIAFSVPEDHDVMSIAAVVTYHKTAGDAASVTLQAQLQKSSDGGGSWSNVGSAVTGTANSGVGTGQVTVTATENVSGTGKRRYRVLAQNTVTGTFTADIGGNLRAEWTG